LGDGAGFNKFFCPTVQKAKLRVNTTKNLALDLKVQTNNTVGGGVLGAKI